MKADIVYNFVIFVGVFCLFLVGFFGCCCCCCCCLFVCLFFVVVFVVFGVCLMTL